MAISQEIGNNNKYLESECFLYSLSLLKFVLHIQQVLYIKEYNLLADLRLFVHHCQKKPRLELHQVRGQLLQVKYSDRHGQLLYLHILFRDCRILL